MLGGSGTVMLRFDPRKVLFRDGDGVLGTHTLRIGFFPEILDECADIGSFRALPPHVPVVKEPQPAQQREGVAAQGSWAAVRRCELAQERQCGQVLEVGEDDTPAQSHVVLINAADASSCHPASMAALQLICVQARRPKWTVVEVAPEP
jgi:hypothetical protein